MNHSLKNRTAEIREYSSESDYYSIVQEAYDRISCCFPMQVVGRAPIGTYHHVVASDFWVPGQGGQTDLGHKWNLALPEDYQEFCSLFKTYNLVGRHTITIIGAKEIEEITLGLREGEGVSLEDPYCLFRFAKVEGGPWHFMLRYSDEGVFQDVAFASYTDSDELEILGENAALYFSDLSFSEWLKRMIDTDCVPLRHNFKDEVIENTQRIVSR
jgi:hypothetical protein